MSNFQNLDIYAGETRTLTMYARDPDNNVQDLTGKTVFWAAGWPLYTPDQTTPMLQKDGVILNATAGSFTITLYPFDTMPLEGTYVYTAITITDGELEWVNNSNQEIVFQANDGSALEFVNNFDDNNHVVTTGTLTIRRSVLTF